MQNPTSITEVPVSTNTQLQDLFLSFCGSDKHRPALHQPFHIDGKVYATDSICLIRTDFSNIDFEINNKEQAPAADKVIPVVNKHHVLKIEQSFFDIYKTRDEYVDLGEDIECNTCDGEGEVEWEFEHYTNMDDCPACKGSGFEKKTKYVLTGKKTFGDVAVKINDTYFPIEKIFRIFNVQQVLGGDIVLISLLSPTSPVMFKIGFCEVLVMPMMPITGNQYDSIINIEL